MANEKPLRKISEAFKELEAVVNSQTAEIEVAPFSSACSLVSPLFGCLGIAFKFAEIDYVAKVHDLAEASKSISTLTVLLDRDIEGDCVRKAGSHSRNLLRVKRGLDMGKFLEGSCFQGLCTGVCSPPWVGHPESCCCRDVCTSY
ncbi:hypothetical protein PRUPE_4G089300 [Prunus persica]|uniref:Glycolipid transfer protein domain-containing protein n=1 Tax=Prunus persica TaxID=3760 RepID=A0A251PHV4_PRUPE|nr:hypothetical protein PRUPE_4G089300 [Prunus persica]